MAVSVVAEAVVFFQSTAPVTTVVTTALKLYLTGRTRLNFFCRPGVVVAAAAVSKSAAAAATTAITGWICCLSPPATPTGAATAVALTPPSTSARAALVNVVGG